MFRLQAQPHLCWLVSVGGHQSPFSDSSFLPEDEDNGILSPNILVHLQGLPLIHRKMEAW